MPEFDSTIKYKDVEGFPGYRVGNDGSVWSCWRRVYVSGKTGSTAVLSDEWKRLKLRIKKNKYGKPVCCLVCLAMKGKKKPTLVHRLVLEAFVGPRPEGKVCRHLNGDATDNHAENLKWGTYKENGEDMVRHGTSKVGERNPNCKLTDAQVVEIRSIKGMLHREIAERYGVAPATISGIKAGIARSTA